jgi:copper transport protein
MRIALLAAFGAFVWTGTAWAHANLVRSEPADGTVLPRPPHAVRLLFDDLVRPAVGTLVIRNGDGSVLAGSPAVSGPGGRVLVLPLRTGLPKGDYSVRWRVVSDDGHLIEGLLAFAAGAGRARPHAALAPLGTGTGMADFVSRSSFFLGVLAAGGALAFVPLTWRPALRRARLGSEREDQAGRAAQAATALIAVGGFLLVFLALGHEHGSADTRFGRVNEVAALASVFGVFAAALGYYYPRLRPLAWAAAAVLVVVPTLRGHALDPGEPRLLNAAADVGHVAAVTVWLGGLLQLGLLLPRVGRALEPADRTKLSRAVVRRFSTVALLTVVVLAATGSVRAFFELSAAAQLWTTGYGRALLVKSALLALAVALAWLNRYRLVPLVGGSPTATAGTLARLRRSVLGETLLLAGAVVAVAVLTNQRPGRQTRPTKTTYGSLTGPPRVGPPSSRSTSSR